MSAVYFLTVNYYSTALVGRLLASLPQETSGDYTVVVANNSPSDRSLETLGLVVLDAPENLGFGGGCNLGLEWIYRQNPQAIAWLINPDAYLFPDALAAAIAFFERYREISLLGTVIYTPRGECWFAGGRFNSRWGAIYASDLLAKNSSADYVECDWVSGCSLLVNLRNFSEPPQFDPSYFLYYEDFDLCQRYRRQGHRVAITGAIAVIHDASAIADRNLHHKYRHSTYSYLLTLACYTNALVFAGRALRLLLHALVLLPVKRAIATGKLAGFSQFVVRRSPKLR